MTTIVEDAISVARTADGVVISSRLPSGPDGEFGARAGLPFVLTLRSTRDVEEFLGEMREPDPYREEAWRLGLLQIEGDPACAPSLVRWPGPSREENSAGSENDPAPVPLEPEVQVALPDRMMFAYCACGSVSVVFCLDLAGWDALYDAVASMPTVGLTEDAYADMGWESVRQHEHYGLPRFDR
jgi:hypothetical protein